MSHSTFQRLSHNIKDIFSPNTVSMTVTCKQGDSVCFWYQDNSLFCTEKPKKLYLELYPALEDLKDEGHTYRQESENEI